jgi:hypothetical protein
LRGFVASTIALNTHHNTPCMENIAHLIASLSKSEVKFLRHIYSFLRSREEQKRLNLLEFVLAGKKTDAEIAVDLGYSSAKSVSYCTLKQRVRTDILNMLLFQEGYETGEQDFEMAQFECRRSLLYGDLLRSRGEYDEADQLLDRASRTAEKFELYGEQVLIDDLQRNYVAAQADTYRFQDLSKKIEHNHNLQRLVLKARRSHYEIAVPRLLVGQESFNFNQTGSHLLEQSASNLQQGSVRLKFYHHLSAMNFHSAMRDFHQARKHGMELLNLCNEETMLRVDANHAAVNLELANICLNTVGCAKANKHARLAVDFSKNQPLQQVHAYIILFFSHFRDGQLQDASDVIKEAIGHRYLKSYPEILNRFRLLQSGIAFRQKDYDVCYDSLQKCSEVSRDHRGWMPGWYLLETQVALEMGKLRETVHFRMETFRKMLHNHGYYKSANATRLLSILNLLRDLSRFDLDFKKVLDKKSKDIELLRDGKNEYWWNPAGYELIRFDEWLLSKANA